jgi:hypothetical protein
VNQLDEFAGKGAQITHQLAEQGIIAKFRQVVAASIRLDIHRGDYIPAYFLPLCMAAVLLNCSLLTCG